MKNFKKGFTLVEMLIVVVIIGILAAALLPRLQGAQAAARDTSRKADVQQIVSAIGSYNVQVGSYPDQIYGKSAVITADQLLSGMVAEGIVSSLPSDPARGALNVFAGATGATGKYVILPVNRNGMPGNGVVVAAKVETPAAANFVYHNNNITTTTKFEDIKLCSSVSKTYNNGAIKPSMGDNATTDGVCVAGTEANLYYIALQ